MNQASSSEDLRAIRRLMEESQQGVYESGKHYVLWGLVVAAGLALTYWALGRAEAAIPWIWGVCLAAGWGAAIWLGAREAAQAPVESLVSRTLAGTWIGCGVGLTLLGEELVFFRDTHGEVKALWNWCPHRGGSLKHGDCHFPGTISCPYHGITFDGEGNAVAVLSEGPDSRVPGKMKARNFPTRTLRGMVFVWMGERDPAPIEEDVPPEFQELWKKYFESLENATK